MPSLSIGYQISWTVGCWSFYQLSVGHLILWSFSQLVSWSGAQLYQLVSYSSDLINQLVIWSLCWGDEGSFFTASVLGVLSSVHCSMIHSCQGSVAERSSVSAKKIIEVLMALYLCLWDGRGFTMGIVKKEISIYLKTCAALNGRSEQWWITEAWSPWSKELLGL